MATSTPLTLTFTAQAPTVAEANAKVKAGTVDALKQNLGELNAALAKQTPAEGPVTLAQIDAASNATLTRWLAILVRRKLGQDAREWRANQAYQSAVVPARLAADELDPVP